MHPPSTLKTALNYGVLSGAGSFVFFLFLYLTDTNPLGNASWLGAWIPPLFMVLASIHYRNIENKGIVGYWQAFRIGLLTSSAGALLFAGMAWIFITVWDPTILENHKQELLAATELAEGYMQELIGESAYEQSIENISNMDLYELVMGDAFNKMLGGLVIAFITAAFVRREPYFPEE
ncbi:MAG: DUF4199 domain-containing protein [Sphingobacteriales bacterium]|jgi:hypothetical protein|nr:DUF4199 domain-containing protein [Sphingobacteriales bacterium]